MFMAKVTLNRITLHGREGFYKPINMGEVDISGWDVYFEIVGEGDWEIEGDEKPGLRKALEADPANETGLVIKLTREEVEKLPVTPCEFSLVSETGEVPVVLWTGTILRIGYKGEPGV